MRPSFHRRTDLGLRALRTIAARAMPVAGADLAESIGTSVSFLPQIMAPLIEGGWVVSGRGPGGGYRLAAATATATLLDVIEATEGPVDDGRCVMLDGPCQGSPSCPIHPVWMQARQVLVEGLGRIPAVTKE